MSYTDPQFLLLLPLAVGFFHLCPARYRSGVILFLSYLFYLAWIPLGAVLLATLTLLAYWVARRAEHERKGPIAAVVILLAGILLAFKIALLTPERGIGGMVMPIGISYYTFRLISYVLDVQRGQIPAHRSLVDFAAYVAFFPQIMAGPIQRPGDFFTQLPPRSPFLAKGVFRLGCGLMKKLLIADNLGRLVNLIYSQNSDLSGAPLWAALYLFPLQLYADFSGLTDIALGVGLLFGIDGPENFNRPYTASSISDFWRRWHMSLTNWLADYVFLPLRMATREAGKVGLSFSIGLNMVMIGLWHGLTGGYMVFGLLNAAYLIVDALTGRWRLRLFKRHREWDRAAAWLGWLLTFHLILIADVFFRAATVADGVWILTHLMTGLSGSGVRLMTLIAEAGPRSVAVGVAGYALLELAERYRPHVPIAAAYAAASPSVRWSVRAAAATAVVIGLALHLVLNAGERSPFLYEIF